MKDFWNISYLTNGLLSLRIIQNSSIDLIWSNAVLEHVYKSELQEVFDEMARILKPGGCQIHTVDLSDHLCGRLENLRFSERIWESTWFGKTSGFYTNRVREQEMIKLLENTTTWKKCRLLKEIRWSDLPTPKNKMKKEFRLLSDNELKVTGFIVYAEKG